MIWIELSAIWDPIMWLNPLWWNFQMKNGGSSFLWWDCEYISVRHLKKWLRLKKRLHFRSCIDEGFPNHQRSKQRNWLCIRESHLFFGKGNVLALPDDSVQHDIDPSIPLESVSIVNLNSLTEIIQYLLLEKDMTFSSLILRKAVLQFLSLHNDNIRHSYTTITSVISQKTWSKLQLTMACSFTRQRVVLHQSFRWWTVQRMR